MFVFPAESKLFPRVKLSLILVSNHIVNCFFFGGAQCDWQHEDVLWEKMHKSARSLRAEVPKRKQKKSGPMKWMIQHHYRFYSKIERIVRIMKLQ